MNSVIFLHMKCQAEGCTKDAASRGYCGAHYQSLRKAGLLEIHQNKHPEHGLRVHHPLHARWQKLVNRNAIAEEWCDFWVFLRDVGDSDGCSKMLRRDQSKPLGPDNFYWAEKLTGDRKRAYYRAWYKNSPRQRDLKYQEQYGIGVEEYDAMLAAQGGVCAICKKEESHVVRRGVNDDKRRLSVDHDHETEEVRGLLCMKCNSGIGAFKEDIGTIEEAIRYLQFYKKRSKLKAVE